MSSIFWYLIDLIFNVSDISEIAKGNEGLFRKRILSVVFISILSSLTQELLRWLFWKLLNRAEGGLNAMSEKPKSPLNKFHFSFASGLGFGAMSGLVSYTTILAESLNPGTVLCAGCESLAMPFVAALITSIFILLHIVWSIIAFGAFEKKETLLVAGVVLSHIISSQATLLTYTDKVPHGCAYCFIILLIMLSGSTYIAFKKFSKLKVE